MLSRDLVDQAIRLCEDTHPVVVGSLRGNSKQSAGRR